jgi:hypothetical protein
MGFVRRRLVAIAALAALALAAFGVYRLAFAGSTAAGALVPTPATSVIGSGDGAVGVSARGAILAWQPPPPGALPRLPIDRPPDSGHLAGPLLQQARVLGAAPAVLRSCVAGSYYGESGVDVNLVSGIELRFGSASRAARKWRAAAAILADPTITDIGYVDLHSPGLASTGGSGHPLPPAPSGGPTSCAG